MSQRKPQAHITWPATAPTPEQLAAWRWLWARLLQKAPGPEIRRHQDPGSPGANTVAVVTPTALNDSAPSG